MIGPESLRTGNQSHRVRLEEPAARRFGYISGEKLKESVECQQDLKVDFELTTVVADRGFDGAKTTAWLESESITSQICLKSPQALRERLKDGAFSGLQPRRGSTEARIAILKNHTGGCVWRAKGFAHRRLAVGWSVLEHNLMWLARTVREQQQPPSCQSRLRAVSKARG